ncbi:MAG: hypothetical protein FJ335_04105 [Sphingomonadales bacterium]|nr:hypothetical protein [Sphingomonadales bacterium]
MFIDHTVRWIGPGGHVRGWRYQGAPGRVWGLDTLGPLDRFGVEQSDDGWVFVAPDGTTHQTMRDLFGTFRLRLVGNSHDTDQLDLMRHALALVSHEIHRIDLIDFVIRGFGGNRAFAEHYVHYLRFEKMVMQTGDQTCEVRLRVRTH